MLYFGRCGFNAFVKDERRDDVLHHVSVAFDAVPQNHDYQYLSIIIIVKSTKVNQKFDILFQNLIKQSFFEDEIHLDNESTLNLFSTVDSVLIIQQRSLNNIKDTSYIPVEISYPFGIKTPSYI